MQIQLARREVDAGDQTEERVRFGLVTDLRKRRRGLTDLIRRCTRQQLCHEARCREQLAEQIDHLALKFSRWQAPGIMLRLAALRDQPVRDVVAQADVRLRLRMRWRQASHHLRKDAFVAPSFPAIVERLVQAILLGRVLPTQPMVVDEDNPTQHTPIIDPWLVVGLREKGLKARHLRIRQPEKIRHVHRSVFEP